MGEFELSNKAFERLRGVVHRLTGIALSDEKRSLIHGRLSRRLRALGLHSFREYCDVVELADPAELEELTNAITTNFTSFFREGHHFEQFATEVLGQALVTNAATRRLRIWSAGCSTGEEAYSIAMILKEQAPRLQGWDVRILATDIDTQVISSAAGGHFNADRLEGLSSERRRRWFAPAAGRRGVREIAPELVASITFKQLNLLGPWPMRGPFDAIFCRNVAIYFDKQGQRTLFERLAALQRPGAWLFIGHSEALQNVTRRYRLVGRSAYRRTAGEGA